MFGSYGDMKSAKIAQKIMQKMNNRATVADFLLVISLNTLLRVKRAFKRRREVKALFVLNSWVDIRVYHVHH